MTRSAIAAGDCEQCSKRCLRSPVNGVIGKAPETLRTVSYFLRAGANDVASRAALNSALNTRIQEIDLAIANVSDVRTRIGGRLNAIAGQADSNSASALLAQQAISELEDLDFTEALSRLSLQAIVLQAAQQSFVVTQRLSLFQFL